MSRKTLQINVQAQARLLTYTCAAHDGFINVAESVRLVSLNFEKEITCLKGGRGTDDNTLFLGASPKFCSWFSRGTLRELRDVQPASTSPTHSRSSARGRPSNVTIRFSQWYMREIRNGKVLHNSKLFNYLLFFVK